MTRALARRLTRLRNRAMNDAVLMIAADDIRYAIKDEPDLVKRIEKAFAKAQDFWMSTDEDIRFRGALAAVILETTEAAEKERVISSKQALDKIVAVMRAAHAGIAFDVSSLPSKDDNLLPLLRMWRDARAAHEKARAA